MMLYFRIVVGVVLIFYGISTAVNPDKTIVARRKKKDPEFKATPTFYHDAKVAGFLCIAAGLAILWLAVSTLL